MIDLEQHRARPEPFWSDCVARGDDGYDRMETARPAGWEPISGWGRDGWDLGSWPYVVVYHRQREGLYELAVNVEGDVDHYRFATEEERNLATDQIAHLYWERENASWLNGVESAHQMPSKLRGPFSWARHEAEKEVA